MNNSSPRLYLYMTCAYTVVQIVVLRHTIRKEESGMQPARFVVQALPLRTKPLQMSYVALGKLDRVVSGAVPPS